MMGAVTAFTSMAIAGREVSFELDTFEIMAWRSLVGIALVVLVITARGMWGQVSLRHPHLHLARNVAHFAGQNLWFYAIISVPLAQVFALEFTAPLWVLVLSRLMLGERLTMTRSFAALLGFAGILLVTRPGAVPITPALVAAAVAAIGFAFTYIFTKKLTAVAPTACIMLWMTILQGIMGFACAGLDGEIAVPSLESLRWILLIGTAGLGAHFCIANALRVAPATVVMPFDFLRLPVIALVGLLLYHEPVGIWVLVGAVLILLGNYVNLRGVAR